jgi:hypothetical protein
MNSFCSSSTKCMTRLSTKYCSRILFCKVGSFCCILDWNFSIFLEAVSFTNPQLTFNGLLASTIILRCKSFTVESSFQVIYAPQLSVTSFFIKRPVTKISEYYIMQKRDFRTIRCIHVIKFVHRCCQKESQLYTMGPQNIGTSFVQKVYSLRG